MKLAKKDAGRIVSVRYPRLRARVPDSVWLGLLGLCLVVGVLFLLIAYVLMSGVMALVAVGLLTLVALSGLAHVGNGNNRNGAQTWRREDRLADIAAQSLNDHQRKIHNRWWRHESRYRKFFDFFFKIKGFTTSMSDHEMDYHSFQHSLLDDWGAIYSDSSLRLTKQFCALMERLQRLALSHQDLDLLDSASPRIAEFWLLLKRAAELELRMADLNKEDRLYRESSIRIRLAMESDHREALRQLAAFRAFVADIEVARPAVGKVIKDADMAPVALAADLQPQSNNSGSEDFLLSWMVLTSILSSMDN